MSIIESTMEAYLFDATVVKGAVIAVKNTVLKSIRYAVVRSIRDPFISGPCVYQIADVEYLGPRGVPGVSTIYTSSIATGEISIEVLPQTYTVPDVEVTT